MLIYILIFLFTTFILYILFLYLLESKINDLEGKIKTLFSNRTWLISSLFELTKNDLIRHDEIFTNILKYRKIEFSQLDHKDSFYKLINTELLIHNELNFIFKVCNKHPKLMKKWNFIYIRELVINRSSKIWKMIKLYKKIIISYNRFISIKNMTILWLIIPIYKKEHI